MENTQEITRIGVSELNARAKFLLENELRGLRIQGEISGMNYSALGHLYFTLKDNTAQVSCALFKYQMAGLPLDLKDGEAVELTGKVTLYEPRGTYQIIVAKIERQGQGKLYRDFLELKEKLDKSGYFAAEHKLSIPFYPQKIGIITSPQGAALRDVLTTLRRRMSPIAVIIYPAPTQGQGSAAKIAAALNCANVRQEVAVLILCRGGGNWEDLWSFNEEAVAAAVYNSKIPVVSGVGHETDFTLADFSADLRAPTPTAAAELVSPDRRQLCQRVAALEEQMRQALMNRYLKNNQRLDFLGQYLSAPGRLYIQRREFCRSLNIKLQYNFDSYRREKRQRLQHLNLVLKQLSPRTGEIMHRLRQYQRFLCQNLNDKKKSSAQQLIYRRAEWHNSRPRSQSLLLLVSTKKQFLSDWLQVYIKAQKKHLLNLQELLSAVSPQKILARGFSIVTDQNHEVITDAANLSPAQLLNIRFAVGQTEAVVKGQGDLFDDS